MRQSSRSRDGSFSRSGGKTANVRTPKNFFRVARYSSSNDDCNDRRSRYTDSHDLSESPVTLLEITIPRDKLTSEKEGDVLGDRSIYGIREKKFTQPQKPTFARCEDESAGRI